MPLRISRATLGLFLSLALGLPVARAQESVAPVEGNRSDHRDWQPTEGEVQSREQAAGVEAPPAQQRATDQTLDQVSQELMQNNQRLQDEVRQLDGQSAGGQSAGGQGAGANGGGN